MPTSCEHCGVLNRANANFCIGCAGRMPCFAPTGPSALQALGAGRRESTPPRAPSGSAPVDAWRPLLACGVVAMATFAGWYAYVTRTTDAADGASRPAQVVLQPAFQVVGPFETDAALLPAVSPAVRAAADRTARWGGTAATATATATASDALDTVSRFYRALAAGDGATAASLVTPAKRAQGPLSGDAMATFYQSLTEPLAVLSLRQVDAQVFEARYTYRATRTVCHGRALVTTESTGGASAIRSIAANC